LFSIDRHFSQRDTNQFNDLVDAREPTRGFYPSFSKAYRVIFLCPGLLDPPSVHWRACHRNAWRLVFVMSIVEQPRYAFLEQDGAIELRNSPRLERLRLFGTVIAALPFVRVLGCVRMASETPAARPYMLRANDLANLTKARASLATLQ
jgi:hypothetical protein